MSGGLPVVNLPAPSVGQQFTLDFTGYPAVDPSNKEPAHLRIFNESGCSFTVQFQESNRSDFVTAGGWPTFDLKYQDTKAVCTITSVLPNAPISFVQAVYYAPGERVPDTPQLGNSPIGISGAVATSSVQTLSNEGNPAGTLVIDMGDATIANLIKIFNDGHATWSVDQSGTAHAVFTINSAGNALQLGKSGDTVEQLGNELVDGTLTVDGLTTATGGVQLGSGAGNFVSSGSTGNSKMLDGTNGNDVFINPSATGAGHVIGFVTNATQRGGVNDQGIFATSNASQGYTFPNGNFLPNLSFFTGTGSGTYTHGFGSGPFWVAPIVDVSGSATQGYDSVTSTQVHVTLGASLGFKAGCF